MPGILSGQEVDQVAAELVLVGVGVIAVHDQRGHVCGVS
jgi:hypothetical protein